MPHTTAAGRRERAAQAASGACAATSGIVAAAGARQSDAYKPTGVDEAAVCWHRDPVQRAA
jgi:hypothetical protein